MFLQNDSLIVCPKNNQLHNKYILFLKKKKKKKKKS